jgi:hypothetical protein
MRAKIKDLKIGVLVSVVILLTLLTFTNYALSCLNPTDSFAFEVLLNKPEISYDLSLISSSDNVNVIKNPITIIYRSHYNKDVAVILRVIDTEFVKGLSVRIQVPTKLLKISYPQTNVEVESSNMLRVNEDFLRSLNYKVEGLTKEGKVKAILTKGNISIAVWSIKTDKEIYSGIRITIKNETLTQGLKDELKSIALSFGIGEEEWKNSVIKTIMVESADLQPLYSYLKNFDFNNAIKVELEWLRDNKVIYGLSDSDIKQISKIAKAGLAGHNSRVVWEDGWKPYHKTKNPTLIRAIDCGGFSADKLPEGTLGELTNQTTSSRLPVICNCGETLGELTNQTTPIKTEHVIAKQVSYIGMQEQVIIYTSLLGIIAATLILTIVFAKRIK